MGPRVLLARQTQKILPFAPAVPEEAVWEKLKSGFALGSEAFAEQLRKNAGVVLRECVQKSELRHKVDLPVVIKTVEAVKGERWERFSFRHGDWGLALAMWAAQRFCGMTLREIGEVMGGMDYAAVAMAVRRFEKSCAERPIFRAAMNRVEKALLNYSAADEKRKNVKC